MLGASPQARGGSPRWVQEKPWCLVALGIAQPTSDGVSAVVTSFSSDSKIMPIHTLLCQQRSSSQTVAFPVIHVQM